MRQRCETLFAITLTRGSGAHGRVACGATDAVRVSAMHRSPRVRLEGESVNQHGQAGDSRDFGMLI